jgi:hypothetical protein
MVTKEKNMGVEIGDPTPFYLDGEELIEPVELPKFKFGRTEHIAGRWAGEATMKNLALNGKVVFTKKAEKNCKCKGRKRFVKLLMSKGFSRNWAEDFATQARLEGVGFQELWLGWFFWMMNVGDRLF